MLKLVSFTICPFVQRVAAVLEAKQMAYDLEFISLSDKPAWFVAVSPTGQVPVLVTDAGVALFESDAIVEYIDEVAPPLVAGLSPEDRARERAWAYQASKHYLVQCGAMQSKDKAVFAERAGRLARAFARAEKQLGEGGDTRFFHGDQLGVVDIAWLPLLHRAQIVQAHCGYDFLAEYPRVQAWQKALRETGLYEKSVASDFAEKFASFYLSEQTFLGRGANFTETTPQPQPTSACC